MGVAVAKTDPVEENYRELWKLRAELDLIFKDILEDVDKIKKINQGPKD